MTKQTDTLIQFVKLLKYTDKHARREPKRYAAGSSVKTASSERWGCVASSPQLSPGSELYKNLCVL